MISTSHQVTEQTNSKEAKNRARWKLLARALLGKEKQVHPSLGSKISKRFELFHKEVSSPATINNNDWMVVEYSQDAVHVRIAERDPANYRPSVEQLTGFNNTGNVCMWSAEEVLAHYVMCSPSSSIHLDVKRIVEVAAGSAGLAGFFAASCFSTTKELLLTDGNESCVQVLDFNRKMSSEIPQLRNVNICCELLRWDRKWQPQERYKTAFDLVIGADCLFFEEFHVDLLHVIDSLLSPTGKCLLVAPSRKGTFERFVEILQSKGTQFSFDVSHDFDRAVTEQERRFAREEKDFDADISHQILLTIQRKKNVL